MVYRSPDRKAHIYPAIAVVAVPFIFAFLPQRYRLVPEGIPFAVAVVLAGSMMAAGLSQRPALWRFERIVASIVLPVTTVLNLWLLTVLLADMAKAHSQIGGISLLSTSIAIWGNNVLVFAVAYWQIDRGGPDGRLAGWKGRSDFTFPRGDPEDNFPQDWQPVFADYLFLSFNTSAAFSPTDVAPLTPRAKMLMMTQSLISLVTVIAVGARAINILGS